MFVIINEKVVGGEYSYTYSLIFSSDCNSYAFKFNKDEKEYLNYNGKEYGPYQTSNLVFTENITLVFTANRGKEILLIEIK